MRKLILLSLLFISTLLIGQSAIFSTTFSVGSFRDAASNTLGVDTDVTFGKDGFQYANFNGSTSDIDAGVTLTGVKTIVLFIKPTNNTKILLDNGSDKLEITGGNFSGTGLTENYVNNVNTDVYSQDEWQMVVCEFSAGINFATDLEITPTAETYIADILCYDRIIVALERTNLYADFKTAPSLIQEYTLISQPQNKDLSYIPNLVASYTFANPIKGELIDEAGTNNGTVVGGISTREGMAFSDAYVDYGAIGNVKTITFRINLQSTTEKIFEGASNDLEVYANAGTLTYPDYDNAYIDGIDTDVITTGWHTITVTSSTNVNLTAAKIGIINTTYGDFEIAENQFYSDEKGTTWIDAYHAKWEKVVKLIDFEFAPVGLPAMGWQQGTGSYEVSESVIEMGELVTNGGFDINTSGWVSIRGTFISENSFGKFTSTDGSGENRIYQVNVNTIVGKRYKLKFQAKSDDISTGFDFDLGYQLNVIEILNPNLTSNYQWYEVEYNPLNSSLRFGLNASHIATGNIFYLDNVSVTETPPLSPVPFNKYLECTASGTTSFYVNDLTDSTYVESLHYYNSGWTDVGGYTIYRVAADNAWFSYSGDKVTFTLTNGQAIDNIIIKNQK